MNRTTTSPESEAVNAVKRRKKHTGIPTLSTVDRPVSPPLLFKRILNPTGPSLSAVEAGRATVEDHVSFFSSKLLEVSKPYVSGAPRICHEAWCRLYQRNLDSEGRHFVIHQHDHPVAGMHYDLRLQCNGMSSISFAIMYGLPGDPNSRRLSRNATETRVHPLWNHLIETASRSTGSLLIWDTGEYTVLPYRVSKEPQESQSDLSSSSERSDVKNVPSETQKLYKAFQQGQIRIRLLGTRLPHNYTVSLRLSQESYRSDQPGRPKHRRRRLEPKWIRSETPQTSNSEVENDGSTSSGAPSTLKRKRPPRPSRYTASPPLRSGPKSIQAPSPADDRGTADRSASNASPVQEGLSTERHAADKPRNTTAAHSEDESSSEGIRRNNAYPGATNTISSIHQRRWFLTLDRHNSGFAPEHDKVTGQKHWVRQLGSNGTRDGFEKFHVLGRDVETSVVTGRLASEILKDEGVKGFVPRGLWRAVTE